MKHLLRISVLLLSLLLSAAAVSARGIDEKADSVAVERMKARMAEIRKHRPTVALVLSGGGAKGAAQVGALHYLDSLDIPVDMVLGTSIGGLLGGLYALGYDSHQMDSLFRNIDWNWVFSDELSRKYVSYKSAKYHEKYLLSMPFYYEKDYFKMKLEDEIRFDDVRKHDYLKIGADNQDPDFFKRNILGSLPSGFIFGQNVSNLISSLSIGYQDSTDFLSLPVPYVCIATDMVSGKAKKWHSGKFNEAMRSTMSIPGVFAPVRTQGMVLVDGGMRDNYPTTLARDMGADIIIGIDLSDERKTYIDVNNIGDILGQGIDMLSRDIFDQNVNVPDVKIKPDLKGYGMMSFNKDAVDTMIVRGYEAALAQDSLLRDVAARTVGIYDYPRSKPAVDFHRDSVMISEMDVVGVLPREKAILLDRLNVDFSTKKSKDDIDHIVAQIYGTQSYDYVTYELLGSEEPYRLVLNCKKGPVHQFGLGVRGDTEEIVSVLLNLGVNTHKLEGHRFDLAGKVSANPYVTLNYSYDMPKIPTLNALASVRWTNMAMLNMNNNSLSLNYLSTKQELYLSNMKWRMFDFKLGARNEYINIKNIKSSEFIGDYDFSQLSNDFVSLFVDMRTDTFDDGYFPTKGFTIGAEYDWVFGGFPNRFNNFNIVQTDGKFVIPCGRRFAILPSYNLRFLLNRSGEIPVAYFNAIGGSLAGRYLDQQLPFIGITNVTAMKHILTMGRIDLRYTLAKNHYVTAIVNYARDCDRFKEYLNGLGYFGAAVQYSFDTIFGPLSANVHWSNITGKVGVYLSAGFDF